MNYKSKKANQKIFAILLAFGLAVTTFFLVAFPSFSTPQTPTCTVVGNPPKLGQGENIFKHTVNPKRVYNFGIKTTSDDSKICRIDAKFYSGPIPKVWVTDGNPLAAAELTPGMQSSYLGDCKGIEKNQIYFGMFE